MIGVYKAILLLFGLLILFFRFPAVVNPKWFKNKWRNELKCFSKSSVKLFFVLTVFTSILLFYTIFMFVNPLLIFLTVIATIMLMQSMFLGNYKFMMSVANTALLQGDSYIRFVNFVSSVVGLFMVYVALYY